jgi:phosphinothricin acetyltransferase
MITIRLATELDLPAINDIYNQYVRTSLCTYQEEDATMDERREWFGHHGGRLPVTVSEMDDAVVGWGSLSMFRERSAYRFTVEDSVYVRHDQLGKGIGKAMLLDLISRARTLQYKTIIAGCDSLQTASIALHEKLGFERVAHFRQVGYKFDQWLDVIFLQYMV